MNPNQVQLRNIFIHWVFTHMMDYGICLPFTKQKILLFRVDLVVRLIIKKKNKDKFLNLEEWFVSTYKTKLPIRLHVLLSREGVRQCKSDPNLGDFVVIIQDGAGYIDSMIDKGELDFINPLFYRLSMHAQIVEPKESINILRQQAKDILSLYQEND